MTVEERKWGIGGQILGETLTLRAERIAAFPKRDGEYFLDLDNPYVYSNVVKACVERPMNAFFDQLLRAKKSVQGLSFYPQFVMTDLIYLDCAEAMRSGKHDVIEEIFSEGIVLCQDGVSHVLVPCDKSASMSRKSVITFIDEAFLAEMTKRLTLDMFREGRTYPLSKVYAYRGLFLSTGLRVDLDPEEDGFVLDERTVVVIPDGVSKTREEDVTVFTELTPADGENPPTYGTKVFPKNQSGMEVNCFDGEGLIDPSYAQVLGAYLQTQGLSGASEATSFQIRLPFGKGMLHSADFRAFCRDEFQMNLENAYILDYFKIPRKLNEIRIVFTASMFKACKWVSEGFSEDCKDPMQEYFRRFRAYEHALYILRTDKSLFNEGYVKLNYQFLNTGVLKDEAFGALITGSLSQFTEKLRVDPVARKRFLMGSAFAEEEEISPEESEEEENANGRFVRAVKRRPELMGDRKIKSLIDSAVGSQYMNALKGNFFVTGENRFLSGDLLYLLRHFAYRQVAEGSLKTIGEEKTEVVNAFALKLKKQKLVKRFYAPVNPHTMLLWEKDETYAVLRNPHLSRNEQLALKAYVPADEENLYQRYLGHLTGVIFLPYGSPEAERLSGADFDGDMVKIYVQKDFNASAKECFENNPLVQIPHGGEKSKHIPRAIRYEDIKDGFNSQVGHLSNLAVRFGEVEYNENMDQIADEEKRRKLKRLKGDLKNEAKDYAAISCILVGEEIDKAKTGANPYTKEVESKKGEVESLFLKRKDLLGGKYIDEFRASEVEGSDQVKYIYQSRLSKKKNLLSIDAPKPGDPNLETLMYRVLDARRKMRRQGSAPVIRVNYPKVKSGELDLAVLQAMGCYMIAFGQILDTASRRHAMKKRYLDAKYSNQMFYILNKQYDPENEKVGTERSLTIPEMVECARNLADHLYQADPKGLLEILTKLGEDRWHLTRKEDRESKLREYFAPEKYDVVLEEDSASVLEQYPEYESDLAEAIWMLSNFSCKGYYLFSYLLKDVQANASVATNFEAMAQDESMKREAISTKNRLAKLMELSYRQTFGGKANDGVLYLCELLVKLKGKPDEITKSMDLIKETYALDEIITYPDLHDLVLGMKQDFDPKRKDALQTLTWGDVYNIAAIVRWVSIQYQEISESFYDHFLAMNHKKRDVDEEGNYDKVRLESTFGRICRERLEKVFRQNEVDPSEMIAYWSTLRSKCDPGHKFLWEVFTLDEICQAKGQDEEMEESDAE